MCRYLLFMIVVLGVPVFGQAQQRARIVGGGNNGSGRCTVEVVVDGSAEVEIRGDNASLRNLSGRPPQLRRFECTGAMPPNADVRFRGIDGRGRQTLVRDPRNGGAAVVRIDDSEGGAQAYTFELVWNAGGYNGPGQGQGRFEGRGEGRGDGRYDERDRRMQPFDAERVVRVCQEAVRREAAERFHGARVEFREANVDNDHDWVRGRIDVVRGPGREDRYRFACALSPNDGDIRSVRIDPMQGGVGDPGANAPGASRAMQSCQRGVQERLRSEGYGRVEMGSMNVDNRPGRADWIVGTAKGMRGDRSDFFNFSCSVDLRDGDIRSVDVTRR
jgi:hypothetical protein